MQFGWIEDSYQTHGLHFATNYTGWENITCGAVINNIRLSVDNPIVDDNPSSDTAYEKVTQRMLNGGTNLTTGHKKVMEMQDWFKRDSTPQPL